MSFFDLLVDRMREGVRSSFLAVLIVITMMLTFLLKSVKLRLINITPSIFPVLISLGLMGCSAIIIGVAVDDTIYF